ncbi:MAG: alpha/beta hydrolase [Burkholderiales bacterium]|nr:alpha/beta hydrolase [Burkholderiales bacterium]
MFEPLEQRLLFRPRMENRSQLEQLASAQSGIEDVVLETHDGIALRGWLKRPAVSPGERFPIVIVLGGVRRETSWLIERGDKPQRWGWLFVNYRGFGLSEGVPSGRAILRDVHQIYDYAAARPDVDAAYIVVLGRSLGAYFTAVLAQSRKLRGAILATPFDSFAALGRERYPWFPVGLVVNGRYDAASIAPRIKVPGLFIFAENDNVTPIERGRALAQAWGGPRQLVTLAGARHYGVERRDDFWKSVAEFLRTVEPPSSPVPAPRRQ